jgi:hypothetical protein
MPVDSQRFGKGAKSVERGDLQSNSISKELRGIGGGHRRDDLR